MSSAPAARPEVMRNQPYHAHAPAPGANRIVNLSFNEGAFGTPPAAQRATAEAAAGLVRYPDGGATALRAAIGGFWGLDPERIVCGAGSDELLFLLCLAYGGPGTELIMSAHGFTMYEISGTNTGATVIKVPERDLTADVDGILAAVSPRTRLVMLANPNNPTGSLLPTAEVERLRARLPPEVLLVLDAAYAEYVEDPAYEAGVRMVDAGNNVVMARTFSKIFGLGGARVGWAYAPPAVIDVLNRVRSPFNVSAASQAAAIGALSEPGWVEKGRTHNIAWRGWLAAELTKAGVKVWPSEGNFILADFGTAAGADAADAALKAHGVMIRRMGGYGLPQCLRITIGTEEECRLVAESLAPVAAGA